MLAFADVVAPIAPEPFVPEVFAPWKLITVMDETALTERLAVTVTFVNGVSATALQISAVPFCALVRFTSVQLRPAPVTLLTLVLAPPVKGKSAATNASRTSLPVAVEKAEVLTEVAFGFRSPEAVASMVIPAETRSVAVRVTPAKVAETVAAVGVATVPVVIAKLVVTAPSGMVTLGGTAATP